LGQVRIIYGDESYIESFYSALDSVAKEKIHVEMVEAPPLERIIEFQKGLFAQGAPVFYALLDDQVIGWCDITPLKNSRMAHRGSLGMGVLGGHRGKGIGSQLLSKALEKAKDFGLEKVELLVYTTNTAGVALYKKFGFREEGLIKAFRKLDGVVYDGISMAKFL
jgi:RimJ/RimL family protein N-acetyltransferase